MPIFERLVASLASVYCVCVRAEGTTEAAGGYPGSHGYKRIEVVRQDGRRGRRRDRQLALFILSLLLSCLRAISSTSCAGSFISLILILYFFLFPRYLLSYGCDPQLWDSHWSMQAFPFQSAFVTFGPFRRFFPMCF